MPALRRRWGRGGEASVYLAESVANQPFGGFEYLDRIYAAVAPGPEHGSVVAWKQGLPPAWANVMHSDGVGTIAPDLDLELTDKLVNLYRRAMVPNGHV